jgi:hypothetical protein
MTESYLRKILLAAAALLLASPAVGIPPLPPPAPPQGPPKLVVAITLDGVSPEILNAYRPLLTSGLARVGSGSPVPDDFHAGRRLVVEGAKGSARSIDDGQPGQRFYWSGGGFVSDSSAAVPASISQGNAAIARAIAIAQPALTPPLECAVKATASSSAFARPAGDATAFGHSPEGDGAVLAVSAALVRELALGRAEQPDALLIGLSAPGEVARKYGSDGQEMCLELLALDRDLGDFLSRLDGWGLNYTVTLTRP